MSSRGGPTICGNRRRNRSMICAASSTDKRGLREIGHLGRVGHLNPLDIRHRLDQAVAEVGQIEVPDPSKVAYLTQTTLSVDDMVHIIEHLRRRFPQIVGPPRDDICYATQNRQEAVHVLAGEVDTVLVVGSRNSSNSQRLAELARDCGVTAHLIDGPADIDLRVVLRRRNGDDHRRRRASRVPRAGVRGLLRERFGCARRDAPHPSRTTAFALTQTVAKELMKINDLEFYLVAVGQTESAAPVRSLLVRMTTTWAWRAGRIGARLAGGRAGRPPRSPLGRLGRPERLRHRRAAHHGSPRPAAATVGGGNGRVGPARPGVAAAAVQPARRLLSAAGSCLGPAARRTAELVAQVSRELAEQGFHTQTLASGGRPDTDLKTVAAIREMVGDRIELRFDGMGCYDLETARDLSPAWSSKNLQFFLDP